MTPVVFLIAGLIFVATAATYAEATTMYPEAGGSSSFARRAFNEFWSFFAAWGQMLNYIITVAISAFFVPHYLGRLLAAAARLARRTSSAASSSSCCSALLNIVGVRGGGRAEHRSWRSSTSRPRSCWWSLGCVLVLLARHAGQQRPPRHARRRWTDFLIAIPVGMVAYTGIETISNMAEEAKDYGKTIPRAIGGVVVRGDGDLRVPARRRAVGDAGQERRDAARRCPRTRAATPATRSSASSRTWTSARSSTPPRSTSACWPRRSCSSRRTPGLIGVSRLTYSMGQYRQLPERLRTLHPKFRTPYIAIIAVRR